MKKLYVILKNDVELKERFYDEFMKVGMDFLYINAIADYNPTIEFISEDEEKVKEYFKTLSTEVSGPFGNHPKLMYRTVRFYDISSFEISDDDFNSYDDLEEIWNDNEVELHNEEWGYEVTPL